MLQDRDGEILIMGMNSAYMDKIVAMAWENI